MSLALALSPAPAADDDTGASATLKGFALPDYREKDNRLNFIVYGGSARNLGAMLELKDLKLDMVNDSVTDVSSVKPLNNVALYPLTAASGEIMRFWSDKPHCRSLIFSPSATYDKNSKTLKGNENVYFRSRELDIDGVGFDAYFDTRLIHIRSRVRVMIRPEARMKAGSTKEEKLEDFMKNNQKKEPSANEK